MLNDQRALPITNTRSTNNPNNLDQENLDHQDDDRDRRRDHDRSPIIRDIHALTPPRAPRPPHIRRSSSHSTASSSSSASSPPATTDGGDNFTTMSREFNALVLAGSAIGHEPSSSNLDRIMEEENPNEETNPLAIVLPGDHPHGPGALGTTTRSDSYNGEVSVQHVKKEEVESKIGAWQNAKIAKINNRFKREDAVINGWEDEQVHKASSWMKKIERKLEEKRAKAYEKMQNDIAKAHRKAEERRASAEAKRGIKVARVLEVAHLMRAVGRPPVKHSFF